MKKDLYFCGDDLMMMSTYAYNMKKIILKCDEIPKSTDNESYVIGINAPWGTGKTHFVKMFQNYLQGEWGDSKVLEDKKEIAISKTGKIELDQNENVNVMYYDAWENDFWDNAFEPLFDKLTQTDLVYSEAVDRDWLDCVKEIGKIIALALKGVAYRKIEDQVNTEILDDIVAEVEKINQNISNRDFQTSKLFPEYSVFKEAINLLREYLQKAVGSQHLVIIIDELDRCKPTFAVQTLEIVKHIFNVKGLIFIFALDVSQLSHCVEAVYGEGIDAEGYLERFFDYFTALPQTNIESISDTYFQEFDMSSFKDNEKNSIKKIVKDFGLSLREFRKVLCTYLVLSKSVLEEYDAIPNAKVLYFYFLTIKYKYPTIFSDAVFHGNHNEIMKLLQEHPIPYPIQHNRTEKENQKILHTLCSDKRIEENEFFVIQGSICEGERKIKNVENDIIMWRNEENIRITNRLSLSYILFKPDLLHYKKIKKYNPIEYIYRQLEMCDFVKEN